MSRATLADVARLAGVSPSTASLTFSGSGPVSAATRERVLNAARELGFSGPDPLARSLRRGSTGVVGVIVGGDLAGNFRDPVAVRTLDGIADALGAHDVGMLLIRASETGGGADLTRRAAMDAAIIAAAISGESSIVTALRERGLGVVTMEPNHEGTSYISIDDRAGMKTLAKQVLELGHERFALVTLPWAPGAGYGPRTDLSMDASTFSFTANRVNGVLDAGVKPTSVYVTKGSLVEEGFEAAKALLSAPERPTVIMAMSDLLAAGVLLAARELGISVPGSLSVTGFDGVDLSWLAPDIITSVQQPYTRKGQLAGEAAVELVKGGAPRSVELECWPRPGTTLAQAART